jgi:tripartite-type tricarboxylate transporter receptor subunit TctC
VTGLTPEQITDGCDAPEGLSTETSFNPENIMKLNRRKFLQFGAAGIAVAAAPAIPHLALALPYPNRPVRLVVGFAAGGVTDIVARLMSVWLSERLGQQFIVENRTGANTNIATEAVVTAPPDGYTLLLATGANAINATFYERLNFNFMRDLVPVASLVDSPLVMTVSPSFPARTVPEFTAYAKSNPGKVIMATAGVGSPPHVAGELFKMMAAVDLMPVHYRGDAPAITDLLGRQVHVYFGTIGGSIEHIRAGKLRPLAMTTSTRWEGLSDIPAMAEFLPGYTASAFQGVVAPRDTPIEIINEISRNANAALADAGIKARFAELGVTARPGSPADFRKWIAEDTEKWARVIKFAGIKAD